MRFGIVVYPSIETVGNFTAHCLNMDVVGEDSTVEGAVSELLEAIEAALDAAIEHDALPPREAPQEIWEKLSKAMPLPAELVERIIANANKRLGFDPCEIRDRFQIRQLQTA
jgi:hypothetical protein